MEHDEEGLEEKGPRRHALATVIKVLIVVAVLGLLVTLLIISGGDVGT